nr:MAG TPA: hypothetical protein [Caudoviricetes sp.]
MALTRLTDDLDIISVLDNEPNDVGGLSADAFKAEFDKAGNIIKKYINEVLLAELASAIGAENIGIAKVDGLAGISTVQAALAKIEKQMADMTQGAVADASISTEKLSDLAVTTAKLAAACVTAAKLAAGAVGTEALSDLAVTAAKLAAACVETAKIADKAVTARCIDDKAVGTAQLGDKCVGDEQIDDFAVIERCVAAGAVGTAKIKNAAVTGDKIAAGAVTTELTGTLEATGWANDTSGGYLQTIAVAGLLASDMLAEIDINLGEASAAQIMAWDDAWSFVAGWMDAGQATILFREKPDIDVPVRIRVWRK